MKRELKKQIAKNYFEGKQQKKKQQEEISKS